MPWEIKKSAGETRVLAPGESVPVLAETDVLVVGGGSAGIAAAVAAARNGARVLLAEKTGYLGGLASGGLIILLLTLDDGEGNQIVAGLCQEMVERLERRGTAIYPPKQDWGRREAEAIAKWEPWGLVWGANPKVVRYSVAYDPEIFKFEANTMVLESGAKLLFHVWGSRAIVEGDRIRGVVFQTKDGRRAVLSSVVIDSTGDGDIFADAGAAYEKEAVFPWLWFRMGNVEEIDRAVKEGEWFFKTPNAKMALFPWGSAARINRRIDATSSEDLTYAEIECRKAVMEEVESLRKSTPGFEAAYLSDMAIMIGITESRRLRGEYVLARADANKPFEDVVARTGNWTKAGMVYNIPYRSLLTREFRNLLVAGRCISVDHRAHHSTKEIPPCFATGEAAGTAAAL
ncbi:MAG: FAD-dependent oxidoreductase, partial [Vicinamibacteria bacterium]